MCEKSMVDNDIAEEHRDQQEEARNLGSGGEQQSSEQTGIGCIRVRSNEYSPSTSRRGRRKRQQAGDGEWRGEQWERNADSGNARLCGWCCFSQWRRDS